MVGFPGFVWREFRKAGDAQRPGNDTMIPAFHSSVIAGGP
jgi:hypothetical protein